jgi:hypothetical protein
VGGSEAEAALSEIAILTSSDGVNWIQRRSGVSSRERWLNGIAYGNGQFVAVGAGVTTGRLIETAILTSADGVTWTERQTGSIDWLSGIAFGNGQFVAVGVYGGILTSADGVDWVERATRLSWANLWLNGITYGNGQFVAAGQVETATSRSTVVVTPAILTSTDGVKWTRRHPELAETSIGLSGVAYGKGRFVAVGGQSGPDLLRGSGTIVTSGDGVNWVSRLSGARAETRYFSGIAYGSGLFVAVGGGPTMASADGVNWVSRPSGASPLSGVAYGNGHFMAVGGRTILESGSIITLELTPNTATGPLTLSLAGPSGLGYTIQSSTDLISWLSVTNITSDQSTSIILDLQPAAGERGFYRAYSQ